MSAHTLESQFTTQPVGYRIQEFHVDELNTSKDILGQVPSSSSDVVDITLRNLDLMLYTHLYGPLT